MHLTPSVESAKPSYLEIDLQRLNQEMEIYRASLPCNLTLKYREEWILFLKRETDDPWFSFKISQEVWPLLTHFITFSMSNSHLIWRTKPQAFTTHKKSERFFERGAGLLTRVMNSAAPEIPPPRFSLTPPEGTVYSTALCSNIYIVFLKNKIWYFFIQAFFRSQHLEKHSSPDNELFYLFINLGHTARLMGS